MIYQPETENDRMFTKQDIIDQLSEMGASRNGVVLVHSSLRAVGETEGRGEGLLDALIEYFTSDGGLLCIPAHTWANADKREVPTLDMNTSETCIGTLPRIAAEYALRYADCGVGVPAVRSQHPTHSMVVFGKGADEFVSDEVRCATPAPPFGCYGKICERGGHILLVGVGHNRNTFLHGVEEMLNVENRLTPEPLPLTVRLADGSVVSRPSKCHLAVGIGDVSLRYPKYEPAFRYHSCIKDGFVGNAPVQLCDVRGMRDVMTMIYKRSGGKDVMADTLPIPEAFYR